MIVAKLINIRGQIELNSLQNEIGIRIMVELSLILITSIVNLVDTVGF